MLNNILENIKFERRRLPYNKGYIIIVTATHQGKVVKDEQVFMRQEVINLGGIRGIEETTLDKLLVKVLNGKN